MAFGQYSFFWGPGVGGRGPGKTTARFPGPRPPTPGPDIIRRFLETDTQQLLRFSTANSMGSSRKYLFTETVHDHGDRIFAGNAALAAVENLVFPDLPKWRPRAPPAKRCFLTSRYGKVWAPPFVAQQQRSHCE